MAPSILITGASGAIGSRVVNNLVSDHVAGRLRLIAGTRTESQRNHFRLLGVDAVHIDLDHPDSVRTAVSGVDRLFLVTGYSVSMLVQSKTILDAARDAGVRHVVHLGALAGPGTCLSHYVWHAYVESYIERLGFAYTHIQPKVFMQNILIGLRPDKRVLRHFFGDASVAWIDAEDIARIAAMALSSPDAHRGKSYRLAEEAMTMSEIATTISRVTGVSYGADGRSSDELYTALVRAGMEPTYAAGLAEEASQLQSGKIHDGGVTFDTVREVTGLPGTRWKDFIARHQSAFSPS